MRDTKLARLAGLRYWPGEPGTPPKWAKLLGQSAHPICDPVDRAPEWSEIEALVVVCGLVVSRLVINARNQRVPIRFRHSSGSAPLTAVGVISSFWAIASAANPLGSAAAVAFADLFLLLRPRSSREYAF
jgi:hypothetical protein